MKSILERLGVKKGAKPVSVSEVEPTPVTKAITTFDDASIDAKYINFDAICADVVNSEGEIVSDDGRKLLDAIIASSELFGRYINDLEILDKLIRLCPNKIEACMTNIVTAYKCSRWFLTDFDNLIAITNTKRYESFRVQLVGHAFSNKRIYSQLLVSKEDIEIAFKHFSEDKDTVLNILANDADIFAECVEYDVKYFLHLCKDNKAYTKRFLQHLTTRDDVYEGVVMVKGLPNIMREIDDSDFHDRLIDFVVSTDKRFERLFPGFSFIYEFGEEYPQYVDKLFAKAISIPSYVRSEIVVAGDLFRIHHSKAEHAQEIEAVIVKDLKWVQNVLRFTKNFKEVCHCGLFERLKLAFISSIYLYPKKFTFHIDDQAALERMIAIVREFGLQDHEAKLRLYYQLLTFKRPLADIINAEYRDVQTLVELRLYIERNLKNGTMDVNTVKPAREVVARLLETTDEKAEYHGALNDLKTCLESAPTPRIAALLAKGIPPKEAELGSEGIERTTDLSPSLTGRSKSE